MSTVRSHSKTVLLVDDNDDTRELIAYVFEDAGFEIAHAASAEEAYAYLAAANKPALVLTDIILPNASGLDLVACLRGSDSLRHVPVIVLTGRNPSDIEVAADVVLFKPVDPYALLETAKHVLTAALVEVGRVQAGPTIQGHNRLLYRTQELQQAHDRLRHRTSDRSDYDRHMHDLRKHKVELAAHRVMTHTAVSRPKSK